MISYADVAFLLNMRLAIAIKYYNRKIEIYTSIYTWRLHIRHYPRWQRVEERRRRPKRRILWEILPTIHDFSSSW